jgi:polyisoprenoid-binding protein YceI
MKSPAYILIIVFACLHLGKLQSQTLKPDDNASTIRFSIRNFGFNTTGTFKGLSGNISFDPQNIAQAHFDVSISASSINTGNNTRDRHLKAGDYFDVEHFPRIAIQSEIIKPGTVAGSFLLVGDLIIKGVKQKLEFPFTAREVAGGTQFEGSFTINRLDFKVGSNSISMSDNATIVLNVLATR